MKTFEYPKKMAVASEDAKKRAAKRKEIKKRIADEDVIIRVARRKEMERCMAERNAVKSIGEVYEAFDDPKKMAAAFEVVEARAAKRKEIKKRIAELSKTPVKKMTEKELGELFDLHATLSKMDEERDGAGRILLEG